MKPDLRRWSEEFRRKHGAAPWVEKHIREVIRGCQQLRDRIPTGESMKVM